MTIDKEINGTTTTLSIGGRLDTSTAPELEAVINNDLNDTSDLIINLENLEYVSSAGLRVILKAQKIMNDKGNMKVINVNDMVMEVFDITGFADILTIE